MKYIVTTKHTYLTKKKYKLVKDKNIIYISLFGKFQSFICEYRKFTKYLRNVNYIFWN